MTPELVEQSYGIEKKCAELKDSLRLSFKVLLIHEMNLLYATSIRQFLLNTILFFDWRLQILEYFLKGNFSFATKYAVLNNQPSLS